MIDQEVNDAILFVSLYASETVEWIIIKKELLKLIPSEKRKLFSTRDPHSKTQNLNAFEQLVVSRWKEITGNDLYLKR